MPTYACFGPRTQATVHVRGPRATLVFYFQKWIFAYLKGYIFHFNISQVNLIFDWALNWPWALEFEHHWRTRAQVIRGIKCGVYSSKNLKISHGHGNIKELLEIIKNTNIFQVDISYPNQLHVHMSACLTSLTLLHHNTYASMHDHMHFHGRIKKTLKGTQI